MVRKASDLFGLLQSRGHGRSWRSGGSGFFARFGGVFRKSGRRGDPGPARGTRFSSAAMAAIAFACLGIGYMLGDRFPLGGGRDPLQAPGGRGNVTREPQRPELLGTKGGAPRDTQPATEGGTVASDLPGADDIKPLRPQALLCSAYRDSADGREALAAARSLVKNGLPLARPYRLWSKDGQAIWTTIVYFDGESEKKTALDLLKTVPAPDSLFEHYRSTASGWPRETPIR